MGLGFWAGCWFWVGCWAGVLGAGCWARGWWLVLGLGAGLWAAVSVLGYWCFFRSLGALLSGVVFGARFWRGVAASFCAVAGLCFLRFAFGEMLLQGSVSNGLARGCGALLQGSVFYVLRSVKFCCRVLFRAVSLLRRAAAAACFLARFLGALGRSFFARFFRAGRGAPVAPGGVALGLRVGDGAGGARPWRCGDSPWRVPVRVPCRGAGLRVARSLCVFYGAWCWRGSAGGARVCVAALRK